MYPEFRVTKHEKNFDQIKDDKEREYKRFEILRLRPTNIEALDLYNRFLKGKYVCDFGKKRFRLLEKYLQTRELI